MTVYEIDKETLNFLRDRASKTGEDLSQLWFDPFFWHPPEMHRIKQGINKAMEYRGLMNDEISFMEIRRKGKKRRKYLVSELLGEGQLFPMVNVDAAFLFFGYITANLWVEFVFGVGCISTIEMRTEGHFDFSKLSVVASAIGKSRDYIFLLINGAAFSSSSDDFLVTSQHFKEAVFNNGYTMCTFE